ncbi:hypothetical protein ACFSTA_03440 [Ornithinibacillus salinisoli]|uniref:Uncharacterized protein n=1 Tax=Ornithinibacillus salinisoli TaxID=1848459 RepID=A0ABW4VW68_9BACI
MKKKITFIGLTFTVILIIILLFGTLTLSSDGEFPIPKNAQIEEKHSNDSYTYNWSVINSLYLIQLQLKGWKKVEQVGSKFTFENNGKTVSLITHKNGFDLIRE